MSETNSMASSQRTSSSTRSRVGSRFFYSSFPIFPMLMALESSYHHVLTYAGMFIQFIQILAFVLNPHQMHGETLHAFSYVVYAFHLPFWDSAFISSITWAKYLPMFCIMVAAVFGLAVALIWVTVSHVAPARDRMGLVLLRALLHSVTSILFIPILQGLLANLVCVDSHLWVFPDQKCYGPTVLGPFIVAIFAFIVVSVITYMSEATLFQEDYHSAHPLARKHYLNDLSYNTWRVLSCVLFHVFLSSTSPAMYTWFPMYACVSALLMVISYVFLLPYIHQTTTRLFTIAFMLQAVTALMVFFSAMGSLTPSTLDDRELSPAADMDIDGLILVAFVVIFPVIGWWLADVRVNRELIKSLPQLLDSSAPYPDQYTCVFPKGLPEYDVAYQATADLCTEVADGAFSEGQSAISLETPYLTRVYLFTDVEVSTRFLGNVESLTGRLVTSEMLHLGARIFTKGLLRFQDSASIILSFAAMISSFTSKASLALVQCERTNTMACAFPTRYRAYRLLAQLRMELHLRDAEYQRACEEAKRAHKEILVSLHQFWNKLITHQDRSQLLSTYSTIARKREETNEMFVKALQHQTTDRELLLKYADFLEQVMLQPERSERLRSFAKQEMEERKLQRGRHSKRKQQQHQTSSQRDLITTTVSTESGNSIFGISMNGQNVSKAIVMTLIALIAAGMVAATAISYVRRQKALRSVEYSGSARSLRFIGDLLAMQYWSTIRAGAKPTYQTSGTRLRQLDSISTDFLSIHNYLTYTLPKSTTGHRERFWTSNLVIGSAYADSTTPDFLVHSFLGLGYEYAQFLNALPGSIASSETLKTALSVFVVGAAKARLFDSNTRVWALNSFNASVLTCKQWYVEECNTMTYVISVLFGLGVLFIILYAEISSMSSPVEKLQDDIISFLALIPRRKLQEIASISKSRVEQFDRGDAAEEDASLLRLQEVADVTGHDTERGGGHHIRSPETSGKLDGTGLDTSVIEGKVMAGGSLSESDSDDESSSSESGGDESRALLADKQHAGGASGQRRKKKQQQQVGVDGTKGVVASASSTGAGVEGAGGGEDGTVARTGGSGEGMSVDLAKSGRTLFLSEYAYIFLVSLTMVALLVMSVYMCPLILNDTSALRDSLSRTLIYNEVQQEFLRSSYMVACFFATGVASQSASWSVGIQSIRDILPRVMTYQPTVTEVQGLRLLAERVEGFSDLSTLTAIFTGNPSMVISEYDPATQTAPVDPIGESARTSMFGASDSKFLARVSNVLRVLNSTTTNVLDVAYGRSINDTSKHMEVALLAVSCAAFVLFFIMYIVVFFRYGKIYCGVCNSIIAVTILACLVICIVTSALSFKRLDTLGAVRRQHIVSMSQEALTMKSLMRPIVMASVITQQGANVDGLEVLQFFDYISTNVWWHRFLDQLPTKASRTRISYLMKKTLYLVNISLALTGKASGNVPHELAHFSWNFNTEPDAMDVRVKYPSMPLRYTTSAVDLQKPVDLLVLMGRDVVSNARMMDMIQEISSIASNAYTTYYSSASAAIASERGKVLVCVYLSIAASAVGVVAVALLVVLFFQQHTHLRCQLRRTTKDKHPVLYTMNQVWILLLVVLCVLAAIFAVSLADLQGKRAYSDMVDYMNARSLYVASGMVAGEMWAAGSKTGSQSSLAIYQNWGALDNLRMLLIGGRWNIFQLDSSFGDFMQGPDVLLSPQFRYGFNPADAMGGNMSRHNETTWTFPSGVENALASWMQQTLDLADTFDTADAYTQLNTLRNMVMPLLRGLDEASHMLLKVLETKMKTFLIVEVVLSALMLLIVLGVGLFMLFPMARRQYMEGSGYRMLIKFIPVEVRESTPAIREYMADGSGDNGRRKHLHSRNSIGADEITVPCIGITQSGIMIKFNHHAEEAFGFAAAEVLGNNVSMLMSDHIGVRHDEFLAKYIQKGTPVNRQIFRDRELHGRRKNGELFAMRLTVHEIRRGNGTRAFIGFVEVIEDRVRRQREEELSQFILQHATLPMIAIDSLGTILRFNRAAEECFGRSATDVIDQNVKILMPEDIAIRHDGYLATYLRTKQKRVIDNVTRTRGLRKNGHEFPMEIRVKEIYVDNLCTYLGFTRDLSDDAALEESIHFSNAIFETSIVPIICTDLFGKVMLFSKAAERAFGYTSMEVVHNNCKMLMPETIADRHDEYMERYRSSWDKRVVPILDREVMGRHKDGHLVPMLLSLQEVRTSSAQHGAVVGFFQELAGQRSLENALNADEVAAENHRDALVVIDAAGIIQRVNRSTLVEFGYAREELLRQNVKILAPPEVAAKHDEYLARYQVVGVSTVVGGTNRFRARRKDGSYFTVELRVQEVRDTAGNVTFVGFMRNLTKDIRMERQLAVNKITMELSASPLITIEADGSITRCNEATERMLKHGMDKLVGSNINQFFIFDKADLARHDRGPDSDDDLATEGPTATSITRKLNCNVRCEVVTSERAIIPVRVLVKEVKAPREGFPSLYLVHVSDVRNDDVVKAAVDYNNDIVNLSPVPFIEYSSEGRILEFNTAAEAKLGWGRKEALGQHIDAILPDTALLNELQDRARYAVESITISGQSRRVQHDLRHLLRMTARTKSGHEFAAEISLSAVVVDHDEYKTRFMAYVNDISEALQLQAVNASYSIYTELSPFPLIAINSVGTIITCNSALCRVFGYLDHLALIGRNVTVLMGDDLAAQHDGFLRSFLKTREGSRVGKVSSVECKHSDGTIFLSHMRVYEVQGEGESADEVVYIGCFIDCSLSSEVGYANDALVATMDLSQDPLLIVDDDGVIERVNGMTATEFGYENPEQLLSQNISTLLPYVLSSSTEASSNVSQMASAGRRNANFRFSHATRDGSGNKNFKRTTEARRRDGSTFDAEVHFRNISVGREHVYVVYIVNMTHVNHLHTQRKMNMSISEHSPVPLIVTSSAGVIQFFSPAAVDFFGYTAAEMAGASLKKVMPEIGGLKHHGHQSTPRPAGLHLNLNQMTQSRALLKNGEVAPVDYYLKEIPLKSGDAGAELVCYVMDRRDDYAAEKAEMLADAVTSGLQMPYVMLSGEGIILEMNALAEAFLGYESSVLQGENISVLVPRKDVLKRSDDSEVEGGQHTHRGVKVLTKAGRQREVDIRVCECSRVDTNATGPRRLQTVWYLLLQDVSASLEVLRAQQRYNSLVQFVDTAVVQLRVSLQREVSVLSANYHAEELLKWPSPELAGQPLSTLLDDAEIIDQVSLLASDDDNVLGTSRLGGRHGGGPTVGSGRLRFTTYVRTHVGSGVLHVHMEVERVGEDLLLLHLRSTAADHATRVCAEFVEALCDISDEPYVVVNGNDHVVAQNKSAVALLGYAELHPDLRGRDIFGSTISSLHDNVDAVLSIGASLSTVGAKDVAVAHQPAAEERVLPIRIAHSCSLSGQLQTSLSTVVSASGRHVSDSGDATSITSQLRSRVVRRDVMCRLSDQSTVPLELRICEVSLPDLQGGCAPLPQLGLQSSSSPMQPSGNTASRTTQHFIVFLSDLSARRALDSRLELADSIIEHDPTAVVMIDINCTVLKFNAAAEKLFQFERSQVVGKNVSILMPESVALRHDSFVQQFVRTGKKRVIGSKREVEAERRDGRRFRAELFIREVRDDLGRIQRIVGYLREKSSDKH